MRVLTLDGGRQAGRAYIIMGRIYGRSLRQTHPQAHAWRSAKAKAQKTGERETFGMTKAAIRREASGRGEREILEETRGKEHWNTGAIFVYKGGSILLTKEWQESGQWGE